MWFGCWLVTIALALVFLWTGSIFFAVPGGPIGVVGALGALLWMMFRRMHLHEVISFAELNLWGVGGGVVGLLIAVAIENGVAALIHHETPIQGSRHCRAGGRDRKDPRAGDLVPDRQIP